MFLLLAPGGLGPTMGGAASSVLGLGSEINEAINRRLPQQQPTQTDQLAVDLSILTKAQTKQHLLLLAATDSNKTLADLAAAATTDKTAETMVNHIAIPDRSGGGSIAFKNQVTFNTKKGRIDGLGKNNANKVELMATELDSKELKALSKKDSRYQVIRARSIVEKAIGNCFTKLDALPKGSGDKVKPTIANGLKAAVNALATIKLPKKLTETPDETSRHMIHCIVLIEALLKKSGATLEKSSLTKLTDMKLKLEQAKPGLKIDEMAGELITEADAEVTKLKPQPAANSAQQNPLHDPMRA